MELGTSSGISNISSLEDLGMEQSLQRIPNIPENRAGEYSSELPAVFVGCLQSGVLYRAVFLMASGGF